MKTESLASSRSPMPRLAGPRVVLVLLTGLAVTSPALAAPQAQDPIPVTVTNSPKQPVPVTGAVAASVVSSPAAPVFTAEAYQRQPVSRRIDRPDAGIQTEYTVPAGKGLVIEAIHASARLDEAVPADVVTVYVAEPGIDYINGPGVQVAFVRAERVGRKRSVLLPESCGGGETPFYRGVGSLTTRLYAGPGSKVLVGIPTIVGLTGCGESGVITLSGYLVPLGTTSLAP